MRKPHHTRGVHEIRAVDQDILDSLFENSSPILPRAEIPGLD
jgi:hypothetical protein